jgi:hypothetical protein
MCKAVRALVEMDSAVFVKGSNTALLNTEERNLLSVAYKHVVSTRRTSWRTLNSDEGRGNDFVAEYRRQLETELDAVCREVLALLEDHLIPAQREVIDALFKRKDEFGWDRNTVGANKEGLVFYLKLCGDYYRYLAEFQPRDQGCHDNARKFYDEAYSIAKEPIIPGTPTEVLSRTNPVRLGLALNYSVCFYEILDEKDQACALANEAFDAALAKLDELDEHQYKDSTLILMLLRDNLTLWSENQDKYPPGYYGGVGYE